MVDLFIPGPGGGLSDQWVYDRVDAYTYIPLYKNVTSPAPATTVTPAAPAPAAPAVFNQTRQNTIGATIMVAYGTGRLGGQMIWSTGIEATPTDSGVVTGMWAFCEPADWTEPLRIQRAWANGTEFYNYAVNPTGALTVDSLTTDAQSLLDACVATMVLHAGGPGELPDATMVSVLGAAEVPAHRGLRTVTFVDFPTLISGNSMPTFSILFRRTDTTLVRVDTAIQKIIDLYVLRTGVNISFTAEGQGIEDYCYGAIASDQGTAIDLLTRHKDLYDFQILDGDPIKIVRRAISSSLVIDLEVTEQDVDRAQGGAPTVPSSRVNPSQLPIGINFNYTDPDADYDNRMQPAMHEGTAASTVISSVQSMFAVDRATARQKAFDLLYRLRAKALRMPFELDNVVTEVSDIILLTTNEGDRYTLLVEEAILTKTRATGVKALALLTEAGSDIDGGLGLDGGTFARKYWPEQCVWYDLLPTATRIWSNRGYELNYNSNPPARRISRSHYATKEEVEAPTGISAFNEGPMFEDGTYVYWLDIEDLIVYRCRKTATYVNRSFETLMIPEFSGFSPTFYHSSQDMNHNAVLKDGKLYVAWQGPNGGGAGNQYQLAIVDLLAWDPAAFTSHTWWTDVGGTADGPLPVQLAVTDNGTIVIAAKIFNPVGRVFYSTVAAPGVWASIDLTLKPTWGTASGNWVYCVDGTVTVPGSPNFGIGIPNRVHQIIVLDCSTGAPVAAYVDLQVQDANIENVSQRSTPPEIFCSPTHLFVPSNYTKSNQIVANNSGQQHAYLARLDHGTLADAGGKFMYELLYADNELTAFRGKYFDGKLYISLISFAYDGRVLIVNEDLSPASATLYPPKSVPTPTNNNFDSALAITVGETISGNLFYGSTETGEPLPSWAWDGVNPTPGRPVEVFAWSYNDGHSVWYIFQAPTTRSYSIDVGDSFGGAAHSVQVYTGSSVGSLVEIGAREGSASPFTPPGTILTFAGVAGTDYHISIRHDSTGVFPGFTGGGNPGQDEVFMVKQQGTYTITIT